MSPLSLGLRRMRIPLAGVAALSALALPQAASAGTITVDHGAALIAYGAASGEANNISIYRLASGDYRIQDAALSAVSLSEIGGSSCAVMEPWKYRCAATGLTRASIELGDGADTYGGGVSSLATAVQAGAGSKTITTGSGDDAISARNGSVDRIACGAGNDVVLADPDDVVDASCESISPQAAVDPNGAAPDATGTGDDATGTSGASGDDAPAGNVFETPVGLTVAIGHVPVTRGRAHFQLSCAIDAADGCQGDVTLERPVKKRERARGKVIAARGQFVARQHRRGRRVGRSRYRVAAGQKRAVAVLLRGHYRYVSSRRRSRLVLRITERDAAGKVIDTATRSVVVGSNNGGQR